jgi:hypothetical protein
MLDESQLRNLGTFCEKWIKELRVPSSALKSGETAFTSSFLLPWLASKVSGLNKPGLYVRGDGGPSVRPLIWEGISFFPDMVIVEGEAKYVSFEVKVLTNSDAGGALNKGIGQTAMYANLGYVNSYGLIFEQRRENNTSLIWNCDVITGRNFIISYFS